MDNDQIREQLQGEENRLQEIRDGIREAGELDESIGSSTGELSAVDQHPADLGTEETQRSIDLSLLEQVEAELTDVERALRKLDDGTYGRCDACGDEIDAARLEALPAARFCLDDQSEAERGARNPSISAQQAETTARGEASPI